MRGVSARTLCAALEKNGFVFSRQKGSHRIFFRASDSRRVTVPMHRGDLHTSTLRSILKQSGLTLKDL
jgi:predicted RNA binding protein YcfA (HicA-like mRNA interferase family)